jgi:hypothetical protein
LNEEDSIRRITELRRLSKGGETTVIVFRAIEDALSAHPDSPKLWCIRGDCIQLGPEDSPYSLEDALLSYEKALMLDPSFPEAHESIGYYFDVIDIDLDRSEVAFREAVRCGAGDSSVVGLARVLSERGHPTPQVLSFIDRHDVERSPQLQEIREEIEGGMWHPKQSNEEA